jgi:hypothetical protein
VDWGYREGEGVGMNIPNSDSQVLDQYNYEKGDNVLIRLDSAERKYQFKNYFKTGIDGEWE